MNKIILFLIAWLWLPVNSIAQVTRISNNTNLSFGLPINSTKAVFLQLNTAQNDFFIWVTDGTAANTYKLNVPVTIESQESIALLNNKLYFSGVNAGSGAEFWVTDGTVAGTSLVKDINSGSTSSSPRIIIPFNNNLYIIADDGIHGEELWKSDGSPGGTSLLKDIYPGGASSYDISSDFSFLNNELFFSAATSAGLELWKTDGTTAGTVLVKDINPGGSSQPEFLAVLNNELFFTADDGTHGRELWKTNGTNAGTVLVKDIASGISGANINEAVVFNNKLLFDAGTTYNDRELFASDGTTAGTGILKDINPGSSGSYPDISNGIIFPGKFIFSADNATYGTELFVTDGTTAGTTLFKDVVPGIDASSPLILLDMNFAVAYSNPLYNRHNTLYNGKIFFIASKDNGYTSIDQLWITDGTADNTVMVQDFGYYGLLGYSYFYTNSALYIAGNDPAKGNELFKSQGTSQTTALYADVNSGAGDSYPAFMYFILNGKVFFTANDGDSPTDRDLFVLGSNEVPLPVLLTKFSAASVPAGVQLDWTTASEVNTRSFEAQRSIDGNRFVTIATIPATGKSTHENTYGWLDKDAWQQKTSTLYYRLKQTDLDGVVNYSKIILVKIAAPAFERMQLTPNPTNGFARISVYSDIEASAQLRILSINGQLVASYQTRLMKGNNQQVINVEKLAAGYYQAELVIPGRRSQVVQFVKE